jgi:hypothetical protein
MDQDVSAGPPKPAPEPGALPKAARNALLKFVGLILLFGFYSSNARA